MKLRQPRRPARAGFTLVEIMIVLVILVILISLLAAAVFRAVVKSREVRDRTEISQLTAALETFKTKYGFYPPSRLKLCEVFSQYSPGSPGDDDAIHYLTRMFPQCLPQWQSPGIDWNGNGAPDGPAILEGHFCLVFFLGGIPGRFGGPTCQGFSTNPRDPAAQTADRVGPFFQFKPERLGPVGAPYYAYLDTFLQQPYAYFSSYKNTNGYNRYPGSDCSGLPTGVPLPIMPYWESPPPGPGRPANFLNPNSFQIISAGRDGVFGLGGNRMLPWSAPNASAFYVEGDPGRDDLSNFYDSSLGIETQ